MENEYTKDSLPSLRTRLLLCIASYLVLSLVFIPIVKYVGMFTYPEYQANGSDLFKWAIVNAFVPSTIMFLMSTVTGWVLLTLANRKYILWLAKSTWVRCVQYYLILVFSILVMFWLMIFTYSKDGLFIPPSKVTPFQGTVLIITTTFVSIVPLWAGYKLAWKSFVGHYKKPHLVSGTMSKQDQYEEFLQFRETYNSGQFFDKYVSYPFKKYSGADGFKPRFFLLWCVVSTIVSTPFIMMSIGLYSSNSVAISLSLFFLLPTIMAIFMFFAKRHDMLTSRRIPYLYPKRGYNDQNMNYYDPASVGVKKFRRE